MTSKLFFLYTLAACLLAAAFAASLHAVDSGGSLRFHLSAGQGLNAAVALVFVITTLARLRYRSWNGAFSVIVWLSLLVGTTGMLNVVLLDPSVEQGSFWPWAFSLALVFHYRASFFPLELEGFKFASNLAMGAAGLLFFKLVALSGILSWAPILGGLTSISDAFVGQFSLPGTAALWTAGVALYYLGVSLLTTAIRDENEHHLARIRDRLNISMIHLHLFGLTNDDLLGKSESEIEDAFLRKAQELDSARATFDRAVATVRKDRDSSRVLSGVSAILEGGRPSSLPSTTVDTTPAIAGSPDDTQDPDK